jgi:hypothetical protein
MSYKQTVLSDYPIAYYPLDDLTTGNIPDYQDIIDNFPTYQDVLNYYPSYANMSGTTAYDYSGSNNHGQYSGAPDTNILPIVPGNSMATKITNLIQVDYFINKDYTGTSNAANFATLDSSDADFSIESWFYPKISSTSQVPIVADPTNNIGLFYEKGNVVFKLDTESLSHTLTNIDKVFHIVGIYSGSSMMIYLDGALVTSKTLTGFSFTNTNLSLQSGPTSNSSDYFLINSTAVYRYAIGSDKISNHSNNAIGVDPIEIVIPDNGEIFKAFDTTSPIEFRYSYPGNKPWDYFTTSDLYYNQSENSISILKTDSSVGKTITLDDYITLPVSASMDSSKIEWNATSGVTLLTSIDGTIYTECENGGVIPQYRLASFSTTKHLYIRVVLDTTDASKFIPKIYDLIIKFYNNQKVYFTNSSSYMSTLEGVSGVLFYDLSLGERYRSVLFRDGRNGIKAAEDSGFNINTTLGLNTLEFFYTPSVIDNSGLISIASSGNYSAANYSWNSGTVSKTNISAIYVNGVNKTSQTSVSNVFKAGQLHHVIIVFSNAVSGVIKFNHSSNGGAPSIYQNISIYPSEFSLLDAIGHYNMYVYKNYTIVQDDNTPSISIAENSANYYDNDWVLFQTS